PRSVEGPDLEAVDGVADVHAEGDGGDAAAAVDVVDADGGGRGAGGHEAVAQRAEPARKALARDARVVDADVLQGCRVEYRHVERALETVAPHVAHAVRFRVVEQHAVPERARVVGAGRQRAHLGDAQAPVDAQQGARAQAGGEDPGPGGMNHVDVQ